MSVDRPHTTRMRCLQYAYWNLTYPPYLICSRCYRRRGRCRHRRHYYAYEKYALTQSLRAPNTINIRGCAASTAAAAVTTAATTAAVDVGGGGGGARSCAVELCVPCAHKSSALVLCTARVQLRVNSTPCARRDSVCVYLFVVIMRPIECCAHVLTLRVGHTHNCKNNMPCGAHHKIHTHTPCVLSCVWVCSAVQFVCFCERGRGRLCDQINA